MHDKNSHWYQELREAALLWRQSTIYQLILGLPLLQCFKDKRDVTQNMNDGMHRFCRYRFCISNNVYTKAAPIHLVPFVKGREELFPLLWLVIFFLSVFFSYTFEMLVYL